MSDLSPGGFDVPWLRLSHPVFEFGEDLFDGVKVRTVGRQEDEVRAPGPDGGARFDESPAISRTAAPEWMRAQDAASATMARMRWGLRREA